MARIRRHHALAIGLWLLCHSSALAMTPIAMCARSDAEASAQACACTHGAGTECPMHHRVTSNPNATCSCRSTTDDNATLMASLIGPPAVLAPLSSLAAPFGSMSASAFVELPLIDTPALLDGPPPKR